MQQRQTSPQSAGIQQFYTDKTIFITGTTGFVGKVILEKIMRSLGDFRKLYVMVRAKKGMSNTERLQQIFESEIFEPYFAQNPEMRKGWSKRVAPIAGDLTKNGLGLSERDRNIILNEVNVIINSAASINFDDPILDALNINYMGCMRMLDLAKRAKQLQCFTHVSTAYVNANRPGFIEEKVYENENGMDTKTLVEGLLKLNPQQAKEREKEIIGKYPNTYTFTKALTERALLAQHEHVNVCIVRPSIVISTFQEPFSGWTQSVSALGAFLFAAMMGLINFIQVDRGVILDIIPVDCVSNLIIAASAQVGQMPKGAFQVAHSSSSTQQPIEIERIMQIMLTYSKHYTSQRQVLPPYIKAIGNKRLYDFLFLATKIIPIQIMQITSKMPYIGSKERQAQADNLKRLLLKMQDMQGLFIHFTHNEFLYETKYSNSLWDAMSPEERKNFFFNVREVDWNIALEGYHYGVKRFYIREDCYSHMSQWKQLLAKNQLGLVHDLSIASQRNPQYRPRNNYGFCVDMLTQGMFDSYLKSQKFNSGDVRLNIVAARKQLDEMRTSINLVGIKANVYYFNKIMRQAMQGLHVDEPSLQKVKQLLATGKKVVLLPIYKSFLDQFVYVYIHNHFKMEMPFMFGNLEDTPSDKLYQQWLCNVGYINSRRSYNQTVQSKYLNSCMLQEVISKNNLTLVFQNSERMRTGKFYRRTNPDLSIEWLADFQRNKPSQAQNLYIVPVMVSYDRIFETDNLTSEMVRGKGKTLSSIEYLKQLYQSRKEQLGEVYVQYLTPMNLTEALTRQVPDPVAELSHSLYYIQQKNTPVTLNSIIASFLLQERSDQLALSDMLQRCGMIYKYLKYKKRAITYMQLEPQQPLVEKHVVNLGFRVKDIGKKTSVIRLDERNQVDYKLMLSLAHNSLRLSTIFVNESCFAYVLYVHYHLKMSTTPISLKDLLAKGTTLVDLFRNEHVLDSSVDVDDFARKMNLISENNIIKLNKETHEVTLDNGQSNQSHILDLFVQMCQVFLDTYFVVCMMVEQVCGTNRQLNYKAIIKELHAAIRHLYTDRVIPHLHSCLNEIITTALLRYEQMGLIEIPGFNDKEGVRTNFIQSGEKNRPKVMETLSILKDFRQFSARELKSVIEEITAAVNRSQDGGREQGFRKHAAKL